eukprot:CAMPEP_0179973308 /NCGR_PEP_ID=MMETSP0983-20121128/37295_1 /TAXON_ID=483367 /ORGANISM="non described non described, Strain CCMP 2436" /LENGTH=41 /DNA_ID= /DNA_START= /DNA_END= /DNA_ORIENTATION=
MTSSGVRSAATPACCEIEEAHEDICPCSLLAALITGTAAAR